MPAFGRFAWKGPAATAPVLEISCFKENGSHSLGRTPENVRTVVVPVAWCHLIDSRESEILWNSLLSLRVIEVDKRNRSGVEAFASDALLPSSHPTNREESYGSDTDLRCQDEA